MLTIWIVHRDTNHRSALARIAGAGDSTLLGSPTDRIFESASSPAIVLLGLSGDFEQELEFAHRFHAKLRGSAWILLGPAADLPESRRLFDTLAAQFVAYPPNPIELRRVLRGTLQRRSVDSLSSRRGRDSLRDRFSRWFADLELPELMRAIDPRLANVPVLIRGEPGTGRTLLARYVHAFGGSPDDAFVQMSCRGIRSAGELLDQLRTNAEGSIADAWTIWLEDVDCMAFALQRRIQDWIEFGVPDGALGASRLRWIAGAGDGNDLDADPGLEPRLAEALSGLTIQIAPLRERSGRIEPFVADTTLGWCNARAERLRRFSSDSLMLLRAYPWPGNLHELEAVVVRTLSFSGADPLLPVHLRFPGDSGWLDQYRDERVDESPAGPTPEELDLPEATLLVDEDDEDLADVIDDVLQPLRSEQQRRPEGDPASPPFDEPRSSSEVAPLSPIEAELPSAIFMATEAAESVLPPIARPEPDQGDAPEPDLRLLVRAVAHEVRNPLVSIRTFSELLPDHYDDPDFRTHFREMVSQDVRRIDDAVSRLQNMVDMREIKSEPVDVAQLLETLLDERREEIQMRRLLVLKELDHNYPHVLGDAQQLRDAFAGLLHRALSRVSDRGDIYIASKHHRAGSTRTPTVRVLLRHTSSAPRSSDSTTHTQTPPHSEDLDLVMAQTVVEALGGTLTADGTDHDESVIVIDLPAPA